MNEYPLEMPVRTEFIRTAVMGPKPCNTLAFIRCNGVGGKYETSFGDLVRYVVSFTTSFHIDGFRQADRQWYEANTLVSATAFIQVLNISTDLEFLFAIDAVDWFIHWDGRLGFRVHLSQQLDGLGFLEKDVDAVFSYKVSAYVLLYEPRVEPPPPGNFGRKLSLEVIPPLFGKKKTLAMADDPRLTWKSSSK